MHRFFAEPSQIGEKEIRITGPDVNHIRNVLRMRPGEELLIADGTGGEYRCLISEIREDEVRAEICWKLAGNAELPCEITLFQGLPKGDKMDLIVQKAVELGAYSVIPFAAKRSIVKLDDKKAQKRQQRWQAIAKGAAEQSGRSLIPEIGRVRSFTEALEAASALDVVLIPYELEEGMKRSAQLIGNIMPGQSVGIFIGPEGGFEEDEVNRAKESGAEPITLGKRILRTETAGMAVLSILMYHLESRNHNL